MSDHALDWLGIRRALDVHEIERLPAPDHPRGRAAVALALTGEASDLSVALIVRASRDTDPWSGQVAMPGGGVDLVDAGPRAAAIRESMEEVALDLTGATFLGDVTELSLRSGGARPPGVLSAHAFWAGPRAHDLTPEPGEVDHAFWFPLEQLWNPERAVRYEWSHEEFGTMSFPGIDLGRDRILWGLTFRVLEVFSRAVGRRLPMPDGLDWPPE